MNIGDYIYEMFDQMLDATHQIHLYKEKEKSNKIYVKLIKDNRFIELHPGLLTPDRQVVVVESLKRSFFNPIIYYEGGKQVLYIPENSIGNFDHEIIKNVARAQKYKVYAKWLHYRKWITTKTFLAEGSIDWNMFDNKWSIPFSSQTNLVVQAKNLSFLTEMGNTKFMLSLAVAFLIGMCFGGFFGGLILGVLT